jgi:hypothetical protein
MQTTNSEVDGGTLVLALTLWFSVQKKSTITPIWRPSSEKEGNSSSALIGSQMIIGSFYFYSGLNKIVDVGFDFPLRLSLQNLAEERRLQILFDGARYGIDWILIIMELEAFSVLGGLVTMMVELTLLPALLFWRSWRAPAVVGLILLHTLILFSTGINFMGNSVLLLASMDLSRLFRKRRSEVRRS